MASVDMEDSINISTEKQSAKGFDSLLDIFSSKVFSKSNRLLDDKKVDELLRSVSKSLLDANVDVRSVGKLCTEVKNNIVSRLSTSDKSSSSSGASGSAVVSLAEFSDKYKADLVKEEIVNGLIKLLSPEKKKKAEEKNKDSNLTIVVFIGLTGAGKTTTMEKYAHYHKQQGVNVQCICADTFRAGAFDQFKTNCIRSGIPFYGSYTESDPNVVVAEGMARLCADLTDLADLGVGDIGSSGSDKKKKKQQQQAMIIVDTAGRYKQAEDLKIELDGIISTLDRVSPRHAKREIILVMDAHIGQSAYTHASFFAQYGVDSIILSKTDGTVRYGGAIAAVVATGSSVTFMGTGEHVENLEPFDAKRFIHKLMGYGDMDRLMDKINRTSSAKSSMKYLEDVMSSSSSSKSKKSVIFSFENFQEQVLFLVELTSGGISSVSSLIPGFQKIVNSMTSDKSTASSSSSKLKPKLSKEEIDQQFKKKMENALTICDSLSRSELHSDDELFKPELGRLSAVLKNSLDIDEHRHQYPRLYRLSRGAGKTMQEMMEMFALFSPMKEMILGLKTLPRNFKDTFKSACRSDTNNNAKDSKSAKDSKDSKDSKRGLNRMANLADMGDGPTTEQDVLKMMKMMMPKQLARNPRAMAMASQLLKGRGM